MLTLGLLLMVAGPPSPGRCPVDLEAAFRLPLSPEGAEATRRALSEAGADRCFPALCEAAVRSHGDGPARLLHAAALSWGDAVPREAWYRLFADAAFAPRERLDDLLDTVAQVIAERTPEEDPALFASSDDVASVWIAGAETRFFALWSPDLGALARPSSSADDPQVRAEFATCLVDPAGPPPDPYDPLGLAEGPSARLLAGTRCASLAVLDGWERRGDPVWVERVHRLRRAADPSLGDFYDLSLTLERRAAAAPNAPFVPRGWLAPTRPVGIPALPPRRWPTALAVALGIVAAVVLRSAGRRALFPLAAMSLGIVSVLVIDTLFGLAGLPPGDDVRGPDAVLERIVPEPDPGGFMLDSSGRTWPLTSDPGKVRVAFVGESTVYGVLLRAADKLPSKLEEGLRPELPCVEVLNLGRPGIAAAEVRAAARWAVDEADADVVVAYVGHNECGDLREHLGRDPHNQSWLGIRSLATRTHLATLLIRGEAWSRRGRPPPPPAPVHRDESTQALVGWNAEFDARITARYRREIGDLTRMLARRGIPLVLSVPAWNHHGLRIGRVPQPKEGDTNGAQALILSDEAERALFAGDAKLALSKANSAVELLPGHGGPWLLRALAHELRGDLRAAEADLWEAARRNHQGSELTPGVAAVIAELGREPGVVLADIHVALHEVDPGHLPGWGLFYDYVHFNPRGARVAADEIVASMARSGLTGRLAARCAER